MTSDSAPSLVRSLRILAHLAAETGAEFTHTVTPQGDATTVQIGWDNSLGTGLGSIADLPRECALVFGPDSEGTLFSWARCHIPERWVWAIDEGLTEAQADEESARTVLSFPAVVDYLLARPFQFVQRAPAAG